MWSSLLLLFDAVGRLMRTLADGDLARGPHAATADVGRLPDGVYVVRLQTAAGFQTQKLLVVR